jgi:hypothetical protein
MLIYSKVSDEKYIWLRIPRTASKTYGRVFFPEGNYEHKHNNYYHETYTYGELPAFSVVRHPYTRFVSAIKFISKQQRLNSNHSKFKFVFPYQDIEVLCEFLNENMYKLQNVFSEGVFEEIFKTDDISYIRMFFIPQHHYVGYPPVKIFRYEALDEFNKWIESMLGFDTSKTTKHNSSADELQHIDFENSKLIKIIERLFYDDYKVFNYPFQHLT